MDSKFNIEFDFSILWNVICSIGRGISYSVFTFMHSFTNKNYQTKVKKTCKQGGWDN